MKKIKVFQAGHISNNSWDVCGYGATQELARKDLKNRIHQEALKFTASLIRQHPELYKTGESLENAYKSGIEFITSTRYTEQHFEREEN